MKSGKTAWLIALAGASMATAGCTTVTSRTVQLSRPASDRDNDGVTYFLPRQLATVTAKRTATKLAKAVEAVAKAQTAVAEARAGLTLADAAVARARSALADADDNDTARRVRNEELAEARAELAAARRDVTARETELTTATDKLRTAASTTSNSAPGAYDVSLTISLLPPSADPNFAYRVNPRHSAFRDDEHKLTISSAGLLTTANTVATDRTADILTEIAAFAGAIIGPVPMAGGTPPRDGRQQNAPKDCTNSPDEFTGVVDFANPFDVARLNDDLQCLGVRVAVEGRRWPQSSQPTTNAEQEIEGIVYRTPVEQIVRIEKCTVQQGACGKKPDGTIEPNFGWYPTQVLALNLPQAGPISVVRQDAGAMTKSRYTLAFDSGMLTSYDASRPSELLEVARTPMRLVGGVFDGISKVISLRTGQANSLTSLSTAQLNLANALSAQQVGAITNQQQLSAAQLALVNALTAERLAEINNQRQLSEAEQLLLTQTIRAQYTAELASLNAQQTVSTTSLAALQAQQQLLAQGVTGQTSLTASQLALLNQQNAFALGQINTPAQLSAAQLAATLAEMRDQARRDALNRCVTQQIAASQPIDICLQ